VAADPQLLATAASAWPAIRSLVRQQLATHLTATLGENNTAAILGGFLAGLLANSDERQCSELLQYLDRLAMSQFMKSEVLRYTACHLEKR
jgi:hypothetical protein